MTILVSLTLATICFTMNEKYECHPVLLGKKESTPIGEYSLVRRFVVSPGYGGDVIQFLETESGIYSIHRVWMLKSEQKRLERLKSKKIEDHYISSGCINVEPEIYEKLLSCCMNEKLVIK